MGPGEEEVYARLKQWEKSQLCPAHSLLSSGAVIELTDSSVSLITNLCSEKLLTVTAPTRNTQFVLS